MSRVLIGSMMTSMPWGARHFCRALQIGDVGCAVGAVMSQAGHGEQTLAAERHGVVDGGLHGSFEFGFAAGDRAHAALAFGPVAVRHVEQRLRQPVLFEARGNVFFRALQTGSGIPPP